MWITRKWFALAALSVLVLASNPACRLVQGVTQPNTSTGGGATTNQPSTNTKPSGEGTFTILGADPPTLDPATASDATSATYIVEIFSGLVTLDKDLRIQPDIAEKWDVSDDGKTYTFSLRRDAKFQDGKAVTANDFKYSFERVANPKTLSPVADTYLGDIVGIKDMLDGKATSASGIKVIDDHTLQLNIDEPKYYFLAKLTYTAAMVVDKDNVEKGGRTWTDKPNGTGAFKLREWRRGQNIILDRNDNFYGGTPKLKTVNYILSGGSAVTMYENDEIDATGFGLTDAERILDPKGDLYNQVVKDKNGQPGIPMLSTFYLAFNVTKPPFDDVKIRQALNYAIDKNKIIDVVLRNLDTRADGVLPPGMPGFNSNLKGIGYDPEKAKQLVAESKYPDLTKFDLVLNSVGAGANPARHIQAVTEMWKQNLGIDVKIEQVEWATFLDDQFAKKYTLFEGPGWIADYPDPQNFIDILFYSKSQQNHTGYANANVDKLILDARIEKDQNKRLSLYQQAEQQIVSDAVWIPLFHEKAFYLVKPYVDGYVVPGMVIPTLKYVSINK